MDRIFKFDFTQQDVEVIANALAAQPLGQAINTFMRFQQQLAAQQTVPLTPAQAAAAAPPATPPAPPSTPPVPNGSGA